MKAATETTSGISNASSKRFFKQLSNKYMGIEERFVWLVGILPERFKRLFKHLIAFHNFPKNKDGENWFFLLSIYFFECTCITEIYESASSIVKFNTRPLTEKEMELGLSIFGETIDYELIRLDEKAYIACKSQKIAYVSFHTINSWGKISSSILIHELMHVWQYERLGAIYIPRALRAQRTQAGYNYGGVEALKAQQNIGFDAFNLEQQADIVADYYRIKRGLKPNWGNGKKEDLAIYKTYIEELQLIDSKK